MFENLRDHLLIFLAAGIVVAPFAYWFAKDKYEERIRTQEALVELLREQKAFLESRLSQPAAASASPGRDSADQETPTSTASDDASNSIAARLPTVTDSTNLTKNDVRSLARFYGLFERARVNPHLRFKEGDISYWHEQNLTLEELRLEFETRRSVLERADRHGERISSQGDLSHAAEQLQELHRSG